MRARQIDVKTRASSQTELQKLIELLREALTDLNVSVSERLLEEWSVIVHDGMSSDERDYHSIDHVFNVATGAPPTAKIGALFHDLVYLEIDGHLPPRQADIVGDVVGMEDNEFALRPYHPSRDRHRAIIEAVFGVQERPPLTTNTGLNEYLSAMLAVRCLANHLPTKLLVQIGACIETTIPFRAADKAGLSPPERLYKRLTKANIDFQLDFTEREIEAAVHQAVDLANRDVSGFATENTGVFLDYTWRLLPESNLPLRYRSTYTLGEYRTSLIKMARFFDFLRPELVFSRFHGVPDKSVIDDKTHYAEINIDRAARYLEAKIAALTVLYSMALLTGGDAPVALFVGDLPTSDRHGPRLEDYLQHSDKLCGSADHAVFDLLKEGRRSDSQFDVKHSPLAAFIYAEIGNKGTRAIVESATDAMDSAQADKVLHILPQNLLIDIVEACAKIAINRAPLLLRLV